jgi:hypothetical protein
MNGCQTGTQCPILHVKQDQVYPTGFIDAHVQATLDMARGEQRQLKGLAPQAIWRWVQQAPSAHSPGTSGT